MPNANWWICRSVIAMNCTGQWDFVPTWDICNFGWNFYPMPRAFVPSRDILSVCLEIGPCGIFHLGSGHVVLRVIFWIRKNYFFRWGVSSFKPRDKHKQKKYEFNIFFIYNISSLKYRWGSVSLLVAQESRVLVARRMTQIAQNEFYKKAGRLLYVPKITD